MAVTKKHRKIIAGMFVEWTHISANAYLARSGQPSVDWNRIAVEWCVALGHFENRPMGASQISSLIAVPRTTVIRILAELVETGILRKEKNSRYSFTNERVSDARIIQATANLKVLIHRTAAELSKLDKQAVE